MQEHRFQLQELSPSIFYRSAGTGPVTLVFMHGWCINSSYWEAQAAHFQDRYQVIAPDLPGFGQSTKNEAEPSIEGYALDLLDLLNSLNLGQIILVGHSMSAAIMVEMVTQGLPGLIGAVCIDNFKLIDFPFPPEQAQAMQDGFMKMQTDFANEAVGFANAMLYQPSTSEAVRQRVNQAIASTDPAYGFASLSGLMQYMPGLPTKLEQMQLPLYLLNSDTPPTYLPGLDAHCPNGYTLLEIEATGHYPMIEKPARFNELLEHAITQIMQTG